MTLSTSRPTSTTRRGDHGVLRRRRTTQLYTVPESSAGLLETARLVGTLLRYPIAQINLFDDDHQFSLVDWDADAPCPTGRPAEGCSVVPRAASMCQFAVLAGALLAVDDLSADSRYTHLPGVQAGAARSYIGVPIRSRESEIIGTLCVMDRVVRHATAAEKQSLTDFARIVEDQLDLIRRSREASTLSVPAAASLARAIEVGEIVPWYQPIVNLGTGRVCSREALARWVHPDGRVEDPGCFVPGAEDSNLVIELDLEIVRQALADLACWTRLGATECVNVNLSPLHLEIDGGVASICSLVDDAGVDPARVTLELTEARRLVDVERAARSVGELRAFGFPVVLDDFGTGWSSLDWIMAFPVTGLKIDRSMSAALGSRVGRALTRATTGLARDLDLTLILEGLSTTSQVDFARDNGFCLGQGYFWSPPVPAATVEAQRNC